MQNITARLEDLDRSLAEACGDAFDAEQIPDLADSEIAALLETSARLHKRIEALQIEASVQVVERSAPLREDKITTRYGWATPTDLIRVLTRSESRGANRLVKAARVMNRTRGMTTGEFLPARYPCLRAGMVSGFIGLDGLLAAIEPLEQSRDRIFDDGRLSADAHLADYASGIIHGDDGVPGTGPLPTPDEVRNLARVLVAYLDPDGAEPSDSAGARARGITIGRERNGSVPLRGNLLPEVAGQLKLLLDSMLNPKVNGPDHPAGVHFTESADPEVSPNGFAYTGLDHPDQRTRAQKAHDAFAMAVNSAARSGGFPQLGGAAPTLVVSIIADDYATGRGWATVLNTGDRIPARVAAQTGCAGGIQRVLFDTDGRIAGIGTSARIFNALQRRAIALRDGGCAIPGCTVPASWCEIHHVTEYADGGPTHTDNGVPCGGKRTYVLRDERGTSHDHPHNHRETCGVVRPHQ